MGERRVTYVVSRWGEPTQTFVRREAAEIAGSGYVVEALSLKAPVITADRTPVQHLGPWSTLRGAFRQMIRNPRKTAAVYSTIVRRASLRNIPYHLVAATIGIAWAGKTHNTAHLHAHFGWTTATATWALHRITGQPYSVVLHAFELYEDQLRDRFTPLPLHEAAGVFTISERDRELVRTRWNVEPAVLRMSVPTDWITEAPTVEGRKSREVLSVGSLVPKKGHDTLIEAMRHLDPSWTLRIAGTGPEATNLRALVRRFDLDDRITFLDSLGEDEVRDALDRCSVFALACTVAEDHNQDGIPVAIMEAMARGVPVVSTRIGAIPELVEGAGLLGDDRDPAGLAGLITTLDDDRAWSGVATSGQAAVREGFVPEVTLVPLRELLRETIPDPSVPPKPADSGSQRRSSGRS